MRALFTMMLCTALILTAGVVYARDVQVTPLQTTEMQSYSPVPLRAITGCQVGNLNPPAWAISNFLFPPEGYKLVFDPRATCACPLGFQVNTVHIALQTTAAVTLIMYVDLEDAIFPDGPDCPFPGPEDCVSPAYQVNLSQAGLWDVALPMDCACAFKEYTYLLSVHFLDIVGPIPALVTSASPASLCTNYNDYGTGWYDLLAAFPTWPGNLLVWADADCCEQPVANEEQSWGTIKALFDN